MYAGPLRSGHLTKNPPPEAAARRGEPGAADAFDHELLARDGELLLSRGKGAMGRKIKAKAKEAVSDAGSAASEKVSKALAGPVSRTYGHLAKDPHKGATRRGEPGAGDAFDHDLLVRDGTSFAEELAARDPGDSRRLAKKAS